MCRRVLHNLSWWLTRLVWRVVIVGDEPDAWNRHRPTFDRTGDHHPLHNTIFDELPEAGLKEPAISSGGVQKSLGVRD